MLLLLFTVSNALRGQVPEQFNINIANGLPSNKVYYMLEDKHGYIWIATPKGVVQYNGYTPKLYGLEAGLSNDDVWELYEDRKGRIWTSSIANEIGYIYNGKYKNTVFRSNNNTLYPRNMRETQWGIMFYSTYVSKNGSMCIEKNDTFYIYDLGGLSFSFFMPNGYGSILVLSNDNIYNVSFNNNTTSIKRVCSICNAPFIKTSGLVNYFQNHIISYEVNSHVVEVYDLGKCQSKFIDINAVLKQDEKIKLLSYEKENEKFFYVFTERNIYKIDSSLNCTETIPIRELTNDPEIDGNKMAAIIEDRFWGRCTGTSTKGLFLNPGYGGYFQKIDKISLPDYKYIGRTANQNGMWLNEQTGSLALVDSNYHTRYLRGNYDNAVKLVPYNRDTSFLLANRDINVFNDKTGTITGRYEGYERSNYYASPSNIAVKSAKEFYVLSKRLGLYHYYLRGYKSYNFSLDRDRYRGVFYDKYKDLTWVYNNKKILLLYKGKRIEITKGQLGSLGVMKIESIVADSFGNVFIKDYNRLFVFNYNTNAVRLLFPNYRLNGATMELSNDKILIAGPFGVLFSMVKGPMQMTKPVIYHNVKNINYTYVYDMQVFNNKILINTDRGFYDVEIPAESLLNQPLTDSFITKYKFLVSYKDSLYDVKNHDTISIEQANANLLLDIINPAGNGKVKYLYRLSGIVDKYEQLNANELFLPTDMQAGGHYNLSLIAYDNTWKSNALNLCIYVVPYWWQRPLWVRFFLISGVALFIFMLFLVAYITNRIATARNIKRNLRLKLELNSVYAQINPHFIFNTLSTALYFIKRKQLAEAQTHITKFSKLLRAYIKFSRNKYITIAEETDNLRNYIELQQARFEDKFDYEITVSDMIPQAKLSIPSLLLQPIVENAISHGLLHLEHKGHLSIRFVKEGQANEIICIIEDDGIGRVRSKQLEQNNIAKRESYGNVLIKDLVNIFNKYEKMNIEITYIDKKEPDQGTIVIVTIKNPHYE